MSQRFGGRYSPDAQSDQPQTPTTAAMVRPHPVGARVNMLFVVPFAFAVGAFFKDPAGLALSLGAFAVLMGAAWLTRDGVLAQAAYDARKVARRPAIPRKIFGSVLTGLGLGLAGISAGVLPAMIFALFGAVLHVVSFGPDPLRDKGMEGVDQFQTDRVARAIQDAETTLTEMRDAIARAADRSLTQRIERFSANIRTLFRAVEDDPRHLNASRRYLGIYLQGARDATVKFADLYARNRDAQVRSDYEKLLDDLENQFALRRDALLTDDRVALDIEIDVLRERLDREGLRAPD